MARRVLDDEVDAGDGERVVVADLADVGRLGEGQILHTQDRRAGGDATGRPRIGQLGPVGRVDEGRHVARLADRDDRERVVDVAVGEQDGDRVQAVVLDDLVELIDDADTGVDHDALLTFASGDDVTVRSRDQRWETGEEHPTSLAISCVRAERH